EGGFARLAGVEPEPQGRSDVTIQSGDGAPDPQTFAKRNRLIAAGPFEVHVARVFPLEQAAEEPVASSA
ncbi:MAG: hypothetical protein MUC88_28645, partial [Planctomycetes bacterium]|nr:hypothetical protein [Planctomycetota bacterium]